MLEDSDLDLLCLYVELTIVDLEIVEKVQKYLDFRDGKKDS